MDCRKEDRNKHLIKEVIFKVLSILVLILINFNLKQWLSNLIF